MRIIAALLSALCAVLPMNLAAAEDSILRIGTSGDYAPFSIQPPSRSQGSPVAPQGFDPALARLYAHDRGLEIEWVKFHWPKLLPDLASGRFDIAMSGITVRPERSIAGRFTIPVATSGAVVLLAASAADRTLQSLDDPDVRIAVNAGGHLERVTREHFPRASLLPIPDNALVLKALLDGRVDAAVTDTQEAPHWQATTPGLQVLGPFTRDRKAYLAAPQAEDLVRDLDGWILEREADGTLDRLRALHLRAGGERAHPEAATAALLARIDERLSLMPLVAEFKRRAGLPIEVPEREEAVVEAAIEAVRLAAAGEASRSRAGPAAGEPRAGEMIDESAVRALFRALIEASKEIQRGVLASAATRDRDAAVLPDLDGALRPALIRIGERISWLVVRMAGQPGGDVGALARRELARHGLSERATERISEALARLQARGGAKLPSKSDR